MLNRNFREFVKLLEQLNVSYMIVGGYAVGYHGHPRYTGDIDIFVAANLDNAHKLTKVFEEFGFPNSVVVDDFLHEGDNIAIGEPPQRIHVLTGIAAVSFEQCRKNAVCFQDDDLKIPVIGIDELIQTKAALMRDQDELDLKVLQKIKQRTSQ